MLTAHSDIRVLLKLVTVTKKFEFLLFSRTFIIRGSEAFGERLEKRFAVLRYSVSAASFFKNI